MTDGHALLVPAAELASPSSYRQLSRSAQTDGFRRELETLIEGACRPVDNDGALLRAFVAMSESLAGEGAVTFAGLLPQPRFDDARRAYDEAMQSGGSRGSLHNYLNIAGTQSMLDNPNVWAVFAHPLLVALVAHALGGPVRIVDLRGKDTHPVDVVARDNTLHVDNTPFMDEFKVIVTWTLGTTRGPSGQGLTYLPRTNRLFRQCSIEADGTVWSDEGGCIFPSRQRLDELLAAQARLFEDGTPRVVHLKDIAAPSHTIFAASRLVHHRYRTSTGAARSAIMTTFHRVDEGTGSAGVVHAGCTGLHRRLVTGSDSGEFLDALGAEALGLAEALRSCVTRSGFVVDQQRHLLSGDELRAWYGRQSQGVSLNRLRAGALSRSVADDVTPVERLVLRLQYDLQGPLNMPLYPDLREEVRKRARIVVREMSPERIAHLVARHDVEALLRRPAPAASAASAAPAAPGGEPSGQDAVGLCRELHALAELVSDAGTSGYLEPGWGLTDERQAAESLRRFLADLSVSANRATDEDSLITATAFGALAAALGCELLTLGDRGDAVTAQLFARYLALVREEMGLPRLAELRPAPELAAEPRDPSVSGTDAGTGA